MVGSPDFAVIHPCEERSRRFATIVRSRPAPRNRPFVCGRRSTLHEPPRSSMDSTVSILVYHASFLHVQRFRVDAFDVSFLLRKLRALRNPWMNDEQNQGKKLNLFKEDWMHFSIHRRSIQNTETSCESHPFRMHEEHA